MECGLPSPPVVHPREIAVYQVIGCLGSAAALGTGQGADQDGHAAGEGQDLLHARFLGNLMNPQIVPSLLLREFLQLETRHQRMEWLPLVAGRIASGDHQPHPCAQPFPLQQASQPPVQMRPSSLPGVKTQDQRSLVRLFVHPGHKERGQRLHRLLDQGHLVLVLELLRQVGGPGPRLLHQRLLVHPHVLEKPARRLAHWHHLHPT